MTYNPWEVDPRAPELDRRVANEGYAAGLLAVLNGVDTDNPYRQDSRQKEYSWDQGFQLGKRDGARKLPSSDDMLLTMESPFV